MLDVDDWTMINKKGEKRTYERRTSAAPRPKKKKPEEIKAARAIMKAKLQLYMKANYASADGDKKKKVSRRDILKGVFGGDGTQKTPPYFMDEMKLLGYLWDNNARDSKTQVRGTFVELVELK